MTSPLIVDGTAMAALMRSYQEAKASGLKGSPTYIIDNGRQTLYGNVGYRVLLANIEEQLNKPTSEASWCSFYTFFIFCRREFIRALCNSQLFTRNLFFVTLLLLLAFLLLVFCHAITVNCYEPRKSIG